MCYTESMTPTVFNDWTLIEADPDVLSLSLLYRATPAEAVCLFAKEGAYLSAEDCRCLAVWLTKAADRAEEL